MSYFTEQDLENIANSNEMQKNARRYLYESFSGAALSVFLSHSHLDKKLVQGWIWKLAAQGINMYVDWNDSMMPRETTRATAEKIKQKIEECNLFVVLATNAALNSRWVSWEIGVADKTKGENNVLIAPVTPKHGNWNGNEYLQLYRTIQLFDSGSSQGLPGVIRPASRQGPTFADYVQGY